jgi:hypothetical protein
VGVEVADHPAAAVEEGHGGEGALALGPVHAGAQVALGAGHGGLLDRPDRHDQLRGARGAQRQVLGPGGLRRPLVHGRQAGLGEHGEQRGDVRIDRHRASCACACWVTATYPRRTTVPALGYPHRPGPFAADLGAGVAAWLTG